MHKIKNVIKATYNGKQVKIFEAWEVLNNYEVFVGRFTAPVKTANKNLGNYITE